jgi:hypothetical protein
MKVKKKHKKMEVRAQEWAYGPPEGYRASEPTTLDDNGVSDGRCSGKPTTLSQAISWT